MSASDMEIVARALVAPGKGILAADESFATIERRFKSIDLPSTEENRRAYRELLFTTGGIGEFIGGAILFDETIRQRTQSGIPLPEVLKQQGVVPGIKVDKGAKDFALFPGEKITEGLDGLRSRLTEYREFGARFTKWRAVIKIGDSIPTAACILANAHALARFAALSQEAGLVPIVEPEVLMEGDHTISRCEDVTGAVLRSVFEALWTYRVQLEKMLLKPNMILPGEDCQEKISVETAAEATRRCLCRSVPSAVPGIVFLSGGQSEAEATAHLNAINRLGSAPWALSFSFGRALQNSALNTWKGIAANTAAAQNAFHHRAQCNGMARYGKYKEQMENDAGDQT